MPELDLLPKRFDNYTALVEDIVLRGIEHPRCELKRQLAISEVGDRFEFIKLLQGLANSHSSGECLIVIGADEDEGKFVHVENADDFDPARLSPMFSKFLDPEPLYEIFKPKASSGEQYILFVLNPVQPRPIMNLVDGQTDGKAYFRPGDIWIKHNTGLRNAKKADLDQMYEPIIDRDAAKRARTVFDHMKQDLGPAGLAPAISPIPVPELLLGSREVLKRFIEARLATNELVPFSMLLEMARATLVDKWSSLNKGHYSIYAMPDKEHQAYLAVYAAEYLPVLQSVVDIGLVIIMYQGPKSWLERVVGLLAEAFEAAKELNRLRAYWDAEVLRQSRPSMFEERSEELKITPIAVGRPAYEIYLGARVLATYAAMRKLPDFLGVLLSRLVPILSDDSRVGSVEPLVFFPFAGHLGLPDMVNGRNETYWHERVGLSWPGIFGSKDTFLTAAAGLELILELSSHIFVVLEDPAILQYKQEHPSRRFVYTPDFWKNPINPAIPTAEWIYQKLLTVKQYPGIMTVDPVFVQKVFDNKTKADRTLFFGEFLFKLRSWHVQVSMQQGFYLGYFEWPESLQKAVDAYKSTLPTKTS